jgi:hypothetical protein
LTPEPSAVPVYYSGRHLIGGAKSDKIVNVVLPLVRRDFPGAPVYLALYRTERDSFATVRLADLSTNADFMLTKLPD